MSPLQIVHLEASAADAAVVRAELERNGIESAAQRVRTEEEFVRALDAVPGFAATSRYQTGPSWSSTTFL
jgi:hypothetical protein